MPPESASSGDPPSLPPETHLAPTIPIPSTHPLLSIEHPAIVSSIVNGIRTLGGQDSIRKVTAQGLLTQAAVDHETASLELRYRPDDAYQHPIISQSVKAQNMVLKLSKSKIDGRIEDVSVVGVVDTILRFRGIPPQLPLT
jgi:Tau95 Triple barrel domain